MAGTKMPLEALLGAKLIASTGEELDTAALARTKKAICLYFSAHWCPPCRGFTPQFAQAYTEYKRTAGDAAEAEVVFVSWDSDQTGFDEYRAEMPWPAIPFENKALREGLGETFGVTGIPALVALDAAGERLHRDEEVDLHALVAKHGAAAFPFTAERVRALKEEAAAKAAACLRQIHGGSPPFALTAPGGGAVALTELLSKYDHVGLILGDGDSTDGTYKSIAAIAEKVKAEKSERFELVYVGWDLYDEDCDHAPFAAKYHSLLDISDEERAALKTITSGKIGAPMLINLRRGTGTCGLDGKCEEQGVPVLVALDLGAQGMLTAGAAAYPWSEDKMKEAAEAAKARFEKLKSSQANLQFLKDEEGADTLLVRTKGAAPSVDKDLVDLGDEGVVGLYFSAHWCPPCRGFTPKLVECYEALKAAGKKFEVVFISSDSDKDSFEEYFGSMVTSTGDQWLALDYDRRDLKASLSEFFEVDGIPTLILLKPDGTMITEDGREAVGYGPDYFPWDAAAQARGAAAATERAAQAKAVAVEEEKKGVEAQRAAGGAVVMRVRGKPGSITHDLGRKTLEFGRFATAGSPDLLTSSGVVYYEFEIVASDDGVPQMGFALKKGAWAEVQDEHTGEGVGDDALSWGLDGVRGAKWHDGDAPWPRKWEVGDVIGLAANVDAGKIAVSKAGDWAQEGYGVVFEAEAIKAGVFPCFTAMDLKLRVALAEEDCKFGPPPLDIWGA